MQRWKSDVGFSFIFKAGSTLFQRWATTLKQRWSDVEILTGEVVAKTVILGIVFVTSFILDFRAVVVAKLVILDISFLASFILALRVVLVANLVMSYILSSVLLTTLFFPTSISLFKSTGVVSNFSISNLFYLQYFW